MRVLHHAVLAAALSTAGLISKSHAAPADTQPQANVPVKEVVLFTSGVGYFEHYGTVKDNAATVLRFKTDQINDILKSLVLEDMDGGKVDAVSYPSQGPLAHTLRSFQIDLTSNPPLAELLNQLRGAAVTVSRADGGAPVQGTVLGVEKQQRPAGDKDHNLMDVWVLNLVGEDGIQPVELNRVSDVRLQDPELRRELTAALAALAQARDKDKKPVEIHFGGQGERRVRIGYVVETPVWKTSYRLILPDKNDQQNKASIQGWAVVENQTDSDWKDVQLSLVSGRPISFIEDLYQPLYIPRPVVKPELYASLMPQTYAGGLTSLAVAKMETLQENEAAALPGINAPAAAMGRRAAGVEALRDRVLASQALEAPPLNPTSSVSSIASAAKVGEFFQYTVGSVTLARQQSAMLPIVTDSVQAERLSIYNQSVMPNNPLLGARIKNTTDKYLMQGPITVLQGGSYAGDANIEDLPPGQQRLISFGVDQEVTVQVTGSNQTRNLMTGRIVKGVLELTYKQTSDQDYTAQDKSDSPRRLVIESPRHPGWELLEPKKPQETTDTLYRFEGKLEPHKASKLTVREQHVDLQRFEILPLDLQAVVSFVHTGEMPQDVRDALSHAAQLKSDLLNLQRQSQATQEKVNQITQQQTRIRENMRAVNPNSAYSKRLLQELDDQETQIQDLARQIDDLQKQQDQKRKALEDYLANLNVG